MVNAAPWPHYSLGKRPGTHCTGGWVGSMSGIIIIIIIIIKLLAYFDYWRASSSTNNIKYVGTWEVSLHKTKSNFTFRNRGYNQKKTLWSFYDM
jgi:hypothetical protein